MPVKFRSRRRRVLCPKPPKTEAPQIARVDALTATGRTNWFALLAYLAFVLVTTLGVQDVDFFVDSRQTDLPLVGVSIPTFSFFIFAPILGAALYAYLHLHIRKVSEALAAPPPGNPPLEERIKPWLLNDYILRRRGDGAIRRRPLDQLAGLVTLLLVWWAGPIVLILMWARTWPAHGLWLSALNGACVMVALYAGVLSWQKMRADVRGREPRAWLATGVIALLCLPVAWLTAANSKGIWEWRVAYDRNAPDEARNLPGRVEAWARANRDAPPDWREGTAIWAWDYLTAFGELDPPDLSELVLSALPPEQADIATARHRYRTAFCDRQGIPAAACGRTPAWDGKIPAHVSAKRLAWCTPSYDKPACDAYFAQMEGEFADEWQTSRTALIAALEKPSFRGKDLRRANLAGSTLIGIDLSGARLDGSDFDGAKMEGANLSRTEMQGANLNLAEMQGANLSFAQMQGANLNRVEMQGADFANAQMQGANLSDAQMQGADLSDAEMQGANLIVAQMQRGHLNRADMQGANLTRAQMQGANLSRAQIQGADLSSAKMQRANLSRADMQGADLNFANMQQANLSRADMQGADLSRADLQQANLIDAEMQGADLSLAKMQGANLISAKIQSVNWAGSPAALLAHFADFRGSASLGQDRLYAMVGNERTLLPMGVDPVTGEDFFIPDCWVEEPEGWDLLVQTFAASEDDIREEFLCGPDRAPQKTGTQWPLDQPPPWDLDEDWEPETRGPVTP